MTRVSLWTMAWLSTKADCMLVQTWPCKPKSLMLYTIAPWAVIPVFRPPISAFANSIIGQVWSQPLSSLYVNVRFVNKLNLYVLNLLLSFNLCLFRLALGRIWPWILLNLCLCLMGMILYWWSWIGLLNTHILYHFAILHSQFSGQGFSGLHCQAAWCSSFHCNRPR